MRSVKRPALSLSKGPVKTRGSIRATGGNGRINFFLIVLFLITGLILYRLFNLTFIRHTAFVESARSQYNNPTALISGRGNIYFSDLSSGTPKIATTNKQSYYVYSNNKNIESAHDAARKLAPIINRVESELDAEFSQNKSYDVIAENLSTDQMKKIKALKLRGVNIGSGVERYYTLGSLGSHALGFVGFSGDRRVGQYGVEAYYDGILNGDTKTQDLLGNKTYSDIFNFFNVFKNGAKEKGGADQDRAQDGNDVVLTVDKNIQSFIETKLAALLQKWSATSGSIIVENPNTGEILGMASSPSFDPNNYSAYKLKDFINPNVQEQFEPGSSFKPVTMAAALDTNSVTPETSYTDTGEFKVGPATIRNYDNKAHGVQTMREVLEHSLNTGVIFAEGRTGDDKFIKYVANFGFGQKTDVDLSGEVSGTIANLYSGRKVNVATAAFGQGVAVTPIQLVNAYSAIANGGKLMWPHIVKEIVRSDGTRIAVKPKVIGTPISEKTSRSLQSMLVDVVDKGFDKARIPGYDIAGKTGTAQIPAPSGGYLGDDQFIHDFLGFAPAYAPQFVVLIKMDKPKGIRFAADSLSPAFGDIARFLIRYFNIPPTR